jgi:hypothetical protein
MHAGNLPGYAASHGCVRLPLDFAQKLYAVTDKGTTVVMTDGKTTQGKDVASWIVARERDSTNPRPGAVHMDSG